jgi:uncharacterized protein (DUF1330 family)
MNQAYVVGQITVKNEALWAEYRSKVPGTLAPWNAELVFRGQQVRALSGECPHADIVVIRFASLADADGWHNSAAYQALIPLRQNAADVVLTTYEA